MYNTERCVRLRKENYFDHASVLQCTLVYDVLFVLDLRSLFSVLPSVL